MIQRQTPISTKFCCIRTHHLINREWHEANLRQNFATTLKTLHAKVNSCLKLKHFKRTRTALWYQRSYPFIFELTNSHDWTYIRLPLHSTCNLPYYNLTSKFCNIRRSHFDFLSHTSLHLSTTQMWLRAPRRYTTICWRATLIHRVPYRHVRRLPVPHFAPCHISTYLLHHPAVASHLTTGHTAQHTRVLLDSLSSMSKACRSLQPETT